MMRRVSPATAVKSSAPAVGAPAQPQQQQQPGHAPPNARRTVAHASLSAQPTPAVSSAGTPNAGPARAARWSGASSPEHGAAAASAAASERSGAMTPLDLELVAADTAAAPVVSKLLRGVRVRHEPYEHAKRLGKASAGLRLVRGSMPDASALEATGNTPQPADWLPSCVFVTNVALAALASSDAVRAVDDAFVGAARGGCVAAAKFVMGQTGYAADPLVHRGVLAELCPGVPTSAPTLHNSKGRGAPHKKNTGLLHASAPREAVQRVIAASHQRAYYDVEGVWLAYTAAAARELAVFELVMVHYFNGVRTGRPMAPVTVELARSEGLLQQRVA